MKPRGPHSAETRARISAAMMGNKNGRPHKKSASARALSSLKAMEEGRAARIHLYLAKNPEAEAARKAKVAAAMKEAGRKRSEEAAKAKADREAARDLWASLTNNQRVGLIQNWYAPHDASGRKITVEA